MEQLPLGVRLRERATFETFLPGDNREALRHLEELADGRAGVAWVWGPRGSGRSHLLQATSARAMRRGRAACLSCPELRPGGADALLGWQGFALLALDDLDALVGEPAFERALFSLFLDAQERGVGLVVSAAVAPVGLRWSLADLGSRFGGCAVFQLRPLDDDGQVAALRARRRPRSRTARGDRALPAAAPAARHGQPLRGARCARHRLDGHAAAHHRALHPRGAGRALSASAKPATRSPSRRASRDSCSLSRAAASPAGPWWVAP